MTSVAAAPPAKRRWHLLALRHLRMANRLLRSGFSDGAFFHSYHAYECTVSALIAKHGYDVPPEGKINAPIRGTVTRVYRSPSNTIQSNRSTHVAKMQMFSELADRSKLYYATHRNLSSFMSNTARNDALYYQQNIDRLPQDMYDKAFAQAAYQEVRKFTKQVWQDIR